MKTETDDEVLRSTDGVSVQPQERESIYDGPVAPAQSLHKLAKWRRKWVAAKARGITKRGVETTAQFNERSLAFQQKCAKALAEIDRAVAVRTNTHMEKRSCIPKKKQRAMGLLPPVTV